jgi:acyl-CoA thioesterase-1
MSNSIAVFGDSIMKGVIYDDKKEKYIYSDDTFVKRFIEQTGFLVDNYAKFGCTLQKGQRIIERFLSKQTGDKYVALEFGGNDCDYFWPAVSENPGKKHLPNTPLETFEAIYAHIIDKLVEKGFRPVIFTLPPLDPQRYFAWISKGLNKNNILKWIGDVDFIFKWQEVYSSAVEKLATTKVVPIIDIRKAFVNSGNYSKLLCHDGIHPNEIGHSLILETVYRQIPFLLSSYNRN